MPLSSRQGLGSPNANARPEDKITMTLNNSGLRAISHDCWALCETGRDPLDTGTLPLSANKISCISEPTVGGSAYGVKLERPISAMNWTTIKYSQGSQKIAYASLPGNANGDNYTNQSDMLRMIDCLNGNMTLCPTVYTRDLDRSGAFNNADLYITWNDLSSGAGNYIAWQGMMLPPNSCQTGGGGGGGGGGYCTSDPCGGDPGPMAMAMAGSSGNEPSPSESMSGEGVSGVELSGEQPVAELDENAQLADWLMNFLVEADPQGSESQDIFDMSVEMVIQWCLEQFSTEEKSLLTQRLTDPALTFVSQTGQTAAVSVAEALAP